MRRVFVVVMLSLCFAYCRPDTLNIDNQRSKLACRGAEKSLAPYLATPDRPRELGAGARRELSRRVSKRGCRSSSFPSTLSRKAVPFLECSEECQWWYSVYRS